MKKLNLVLLSGVCALTLSSCSWLSEWPPSGEQRAMAPAPAEAPQSRLMQTADATWIEPAAGDPVAHNISADGTTSKAVQDRLNALEAKIAKMQSDMSMMMPALTRLAEVQGDLQALLSSQIQPAAGNAREAVDNMYGGGASYNAAAVAAQGQSGGIAPQSTAQKNMPSNGQYALQMAAQRQSEQGGNTQVAAAKADQGYDDNMSAAVAATPAPQTMQQGGVTQAATTGGEIMDVRFGEHPDKTRIVLDVNKKVAFDYDVDNTENILILDLGGRWDGVQRRAVSGSDIIAAYTTTPDGQGGTHMAIQLKQAGKVSWAQYIPPSGSKGHRIVIDVAGL